MAESKNSLDSNSVLIEKKLMEHFRQIRKSRGIRAFKIADELGIDRGWFSRIERSQTKAPFSIRQFFDFCLVYKVDPIETLNEVYQKFDKQVHYKFIENGK